MSKSYVFCIRCVFSYFPRFRGLYQASNISTSGGYTLPRVAMVEAWESPRNRGKYEKTHRIQETYDFDIFRASENDQQMIHGIRFDRFAAASRPQTSQFCIVCMCFCSFSDARKNVKIVYFFIRCVFPSFPDSGGSRRPANS